MKAPMPNLVPPDSPLSCPLLSRRLLLAAASLGAMGASPAPLSFSGLYGPVTAQGIQLTPSAQALVGRSVELRGFMAPPLKAESDFFVLTRYPMSICPFCSNAADWPVDVVLVRLGATAETIEPSYAIDVTGVLEHGMKVDPETGFVSLVRLVDAAWHRV